MVVFFAALLGIDQFVAVRGQLALAAATWLVFLATWRPLPADRRAQALLVVLVATCGEVIGSIIWGVYTYRLENLPMFVPPAHGLVYLTGLRLSECRVVKCNTRVFVGAVLAFAAAWAVAGLTVLPRTDVVGAVGAVAFAGFVLRGRAPATYAGVFVAVAALEIYGTAIGTWRWEEIVPGTRVPNGNPPSGVASGYVLFDAVALALAPRLVALARAARSAFAEGRDQRLRDDLERTPRDLARAA